MNHWMYNCKEVTRMVSESLDRRLPLRQRIGLRFHLFMCKLCSRYRRQLLILREAMRHRERGVEDTEPSLTLHPKARERIKRSLMNSLNNS
jgi:hypothetical protein